MSNRIKCPYCGEEPRWCSNEVVYGRKIGNSHMIYLCRPCDAYVGCHQNTRKPLGTLANKELRLWRRRAHAAIDPLWRAQKGREKGKMRKKIYRALEEHFGREVHIGESDIDLCRDIIVLVHTRKLYSLIHAG